MFRKVVNHPSYWRILSFTLFAVVAAGIPFSVNAQQTDPPEAVAMYNTAANLYKDQQYDLAIKQWMQLLEDYPGCSLRRDTQFYTAMAHFNQKQFSESVDLFSSLRDSLPNLKDYRRTEKTLFYLAYCQSQVGKAKGEDGVESLRQSLKTYDQFFDNFAGSDRMAEALYYHGDTLYELNRFDSSADTLGRATTSYKKVVEQHPDAEIAKKARYAYGACLEDSGDYRQAREVYTRYIDDFPNDPFTDEVRLRKADTLLKLGIASDNAGDAVDARSFYESADRIYQQLTSNPELSLLPTALNQRAFCLLQLGNYLQAADLYATIANDHSDFEYANDAMRDAGKYYYEAGKLDVAEKWLTRFLERNDQDLGEATHWLCKIKLKNEQFADALKLATEALDQNPGAWQVNLRMDAADAMYGIPERRLESLEAYESLANEHPDHAIAPNALYYACFGQMTEGRNADAIKTANRFRQAYSDNEFLPDTLDVLGRVALREQNYSLAQEAYAELVDRFDEDPRHDWWQTRTGWISYLQNRYDDAIARMSQTVLDMKDPNSISEAHYVIGSSQYELKNHVKAIESLTAALDANPDHAKANEVRLLTARAHFNLNETDPAITLAQKVWDATSNPEAAYWLGEFTYRAGKYATAAGHYRNVLDHKTKSQWTPDAMYGLAWSHSSNGNAELALKAFDDLIREFPDHELVNEALIGRGKTRRIAGDFDDAIEDLSRFLDGDPDDASRFNATFERALCFVGLKNWDSAIKDLEDLATDLPANPDLADDVLFELAWACQENQQADKSVKLFQQIADDYPDSPHAAESNYHVGQNLYAQEQFAQAIPRYEKALADAPDARVGELAAYKKAWCHFKQSDYTESVKAFQLQTDRYPDGELNAVGLSMIAESHFQLKQHAQAVTAYKVAIPAIESSNVQNNVRVLAPIHAAQSANKVKDYEAALEYAKIVIDNHADSPYAADAWYETGVARKGLGNKDKAVEAWTTAMKNSLGKTGARARCMIGEELFADKKYDDAITQFKLVIYGYGGTESADDIKPWQAFAAYEAARCNYVQISETRDEARRKILIDNARELFQMIVDDYPDDHLAADARKQIGVLESLK